MEYQQVELVLDKFSSGGYSIYAQKSVIEDYAKRGDLTKALNFLQKRYKNEIDKDVSIQLHDMKMFNAVFDQTKKINPVLYESFSSMLVYLASEAEQFSLVWNLIESFPDPSWRSRELTSLGYSLGKMVGFGMMRLMSSCASL